MPDFPSILPPNASQVQRDLEQIVAGYIADMPAHFIKGAHNPRLARADFLPWLAWAWSVDGWDADWSEDTQRESIWASPGVHRHKGTLMAVNASLKAAGYGDAVVLEHYGNQRRDGTHRRDGTVARARPDEWFEYRVILSRPITAGQAQKVRAILAQVAPVRSRLKALDFREAQFLRDGSVRRDGTYTRGLA